VKAPRRAGACLRHIRAREKDGFRLTMLQRFKVEPVGSDLLSAGLFLCLEYRMRIINLFCVKRVNKKMIFVW